MGKKSSKNAPEGQPRGSPATPVPTAGTLSLRVGLQEGVGPPDHLDPVFQPSHQKNPRELCRTARPPPHPPLPLASLRPPQAPRKRGATSLMDDSEAQQDRARQHAGPGQPTPGPVAACGRWCPGSRPLGAPAGASPRAPSSRVAPTLHLGSVSLRPADLPVCGSPTPTVLSPPPPPPQPTLISGKIGQDPRGAGAAYISCRCLGHKGQPPTTPLTKDLKEALCSGELPRGSGLC